MTPAEALREKVGVSVFPDDLFGENCYLIRRRDTTTAVCVDPGLQVEGVLRRIEQERLTVERILVTHGHIDHVGGVPAMHRETKAPIAMHPDDLAILDWDQFGQLPFLPPGFAPFVIDIRLAHDATLPFAQYSFSWTLATSLAAGHQLELKLAASGGNRDVNLAYDTAANASYLHLP